MDPFGPIAPFYDELMQGVPYRMWVDYYHLLLSLRDSRPTKLLDVCCGTGIVAELLSDEGYDVVGVDMSASMIREARRKARAQGRALRYLRADVADLDLGERFDGAYSFFDSLNYILEADRLRRALIAIANHLEPRSVFVFDLNTAYAFEQRMFDQSRLWPRARLRYDWKGEWNPETRLITVRMKFWKGSREFQAVHTQRAHSDEEVRTFLYGAGFTDVARYHSYTLQPATNTSDRVHYVATKA